MIFSVRRITVRVGRYEGFFTEENIGNPFLGNYSDTKIYKTLFGYDVKLIHHYRIDKKGKFYKGK